MDSQQQKTLQVINLIDDELAFAVCYEEDDVMKVTQWLNTEEGQQFVLIDPFAPTEGLKAFIDNIKGKFVENIKVNSPTATTALPSNYCSILDEKITKQVAPDELFDTLQKSFNDALIFSSFHLDYGPFTWTQSFRLGQNMRKVREAGMRVKVLVSREYENVAKKKDVNGGNSKRKHITFGDDVHGGEDDGGPLTSMLLLRCYGDLEAFTNILTSLMVMSVQLGVIRSVDNIRKFFSYEDLLSRALVFHDASPHDDMESNYDLTVEDVAKGAIRAVNLWGLQVLGDEEGFIEPSEQFLKLKYGDMSWIVPGETVAFSCPVTDEDFIKFRNRHNVDDDSDLPVPDRIGLPGEYYANLFGSSMDSSFFGGVGAVIKLNEEMYNIDIFEKKGVEHISMVYEDGSIPPSSVVDKFLAIMHRIRKAKNGVAVHCMAGLGRTGTLLCIDLIVNFGFLAKEAIGWCRLMRPGCVIGPQQQFLSWYENAFKRLKHTRDFPKPAAKLANNDVIQQENDAVPYQPNEMTATLTTDMIMKKKADASFTRSTVTQERIVSRDLSSKKLSVSESLPPNGHFSSEKSINSREEPRGMSYLLPPRAVSRSPSCPSVASTAGPPASLTFHPFTRLGSHNISNVNSEVRAPPPPTEALSNGHPEHAKVRLSSSPTEDTRHMRTTGTSVCDSRTSSSGSQRFGLDRKEAVAHHQNGAKAKLHIDTTAEIPPVASTVNPVLSNSHSNKATHTGTKSPPRRIAIEPLSPWKSSSDDGVDPPHTTSRQTMSSQAIGDNTRQDPHQVQPHRQQDISTLPLVYEMHRSGGGESRNGVTTPNARTSPHTRTASGSKVFIVGSGLIDRSNYNRGVDKEVIDTSQKRKLVSNQGDQDSRNHRTHDGAAHVVRHSVTEHQALPRQPPNGPLTDSGKHLYDRSNASNTIKASRLTPPPPPGTPPSYRNLLHINVTSSSSYDTLPKSNKSSASANYRHTGDLSQVTSGLPVSGFIEPQSSASTRPGANELSTNNPTSENKRDYPTATGGNYFSPSRRVLIYLDDE